MMSSSSSSSYPSYYDSHGDYQADDASGRFSLSKDLPLYEAQDTLPRFPVNSIADTIEKLKSSCLALVTSDGDEGNREREDFLAACEAFPEQAVDLQRRLEDRARTEDNWLQSWWNRIGYLGFRDPSPINVNYIFSFPKTRSGNDGGRLYASDPLLRGAKLLHSVFAYSELVRSGKLPQARIGKHRTPLCSSMYKYMFYACRIPKPEQDVYRIYHCKHEDDDHGSFLPKHAVVSARGHYFAVDLTDPTDGRPYSVRELEIALRECVDRAEALVDRDGSAGAAADAVRNLGLLTTANRDEWASHRSALIDEIGGMRDAMRQLESGLVLLCLDVDGDVDSSSNPSSSSSADTAGRPSFPDSLSQNSRTYLMGTQGRWYDKSIQFVMTPTGNLGLNGEHSMMDGMPVVGLHDYVLQQEQNGADEPEPSTASHPSVKPIFASQAVLDGLGESELNFIRSMKEKAASDFDTIRHSLDLEVQSFRGYGAEWIKKHGKCSPDAYVQIAIQLAMGKLTRAVAATKGDGSSTAYIPRATYESTQVRPFKYGRTETTRSVSAQSVEWVEAMLNHPHTRNSTDLRTKLFHRAADAHSDYIRKAAKGLGIDRHLFGLQMIQAEQEEEEKGSTAEVALFRDPLFLRSKQWLVSTSTVPANPGFGPVVIPEGVGIAYDLKPDHVYLTCTSYLGSAPALSHFLEESLLEMRELVISGGDRGRSKL